MTFWNGKFIGVSLLLACCCCPPTAASPDKNVIRSASEYDYPPLAIVRPDGQPDGFSVEMLREAAKAMGLDVQFTVGPWSQLKRELAGGKLDVLPLVGRTPERERVYDFTLPYLTLHGAVLVRAGDSRVKNVADLRDKEVIVMRGDNAEEYALRNHVAGKLVAVDTYEEALRQLASGRGDAVIAQRLMALQLIKDCGIKGLKVLELPLIDFRQSFCFAVKEGDKDLLSTLNEGLAVVIANGTLARLQAKWLGPLEQEGHVPRTMYYIAASSIALLLLVSLGAWLWQASLHRKVEERTRQLREREAEITALNAGLESTVQQRTADLRGAVESLRKSEERFRCIVESTTDAVVVWDRRHVCLYANQPAVDANQLSREEFIGGELSALLPRRPEVAAAWAARIDQVFVDGKPLGVSDAFTYEGTTTYSESTLSPLRDGDGQVFAVGVVYRNVTERKTAEVELRKAMEAAEVANRTKSEFLANMSHEIRTPLNSIMGFTEILRDSQVEPWLAKQYLDNIISSGKTLLTLINDILDISRVEAGKLEVKEGVVALRAMLKDMKMMFAPLAWRKRLEFKLELEAEVPERIVTDEARLRQILLNLLNNAIKFTDSGHVKLSAGARRLDSGRTSLTFNVEDSGIGIAAAKLEEVFKPFEQVCDQRRQRQGSGLGLAISKRLAELMRGRLSVSSVTGKGCVFTLTFDEVACVTMDADAAMDAKPDGRLRFHDATVLIVDDVEFNRKLLRGYLNGNDVGMFESCNGKEAVEMVKSCGPDLILMDVKMPIMGGIEATAAIHALPGWERVPVIAVSASTMKEDRELYGKVFDGVLSKPISRLELYSMLKRFLPHDIVPAAMAVEAPRTEPATPGVSTSLASLVKLTLVPCWQNHDGMSTDELERFAILAISMGGEHGCEALRRWGEDLRRAAISFDLGAAERCLADFPKLLDLLENQQ